MEQDDEKYYDLVMDKFCFSQTGETLDYVRNVSFNVPLSMGSSATDSVVMMSNAVMEKC